MLLDKFTPLAIGGTAVGIWLLLWPRPAWLFDTVGGTVSRVAKRPWLPFNVVETLSRSAISSIGLSISAGAFAAVLRLADGSTRELSRSDSFFAIDAALRRLSAAMQIPRVDDNIQLSERPHSTKIALTRVGDSLVLHYVSMPWMGVVKVVSIAIPVLFICYAAWTSGIYMGLIAALMILFFLGPAFWKKETRSVEFNLTAKTVMVVSSRVWRQSTTVIPFLRIKSICLVETTSSSEGPSADYTPYLCLVDDSKHALGPPSEYFLWDPLLVDIAQETGLSRTSQPR